MKNRLTRAGVGAFVSLAALALFAGLAQAKPKNAVEVTVMTRNLFLGADLGPALNSTGFESFIEANGAILREVDSTSFPARAPALAAEIKKQKPDLVGLQEVALWRTGPVAIPPTISNPPAPFTATTVRYDFLQLLLDELNKGTSKKYAGYRAAVIEEEFDFEAPADLNDVDNDAPPGTFNSDPDTNDESASSLDDAELNGRLTMRDVILVRKGAGVKVKNATGGNYTNIYTPQVSGIDIPVARGFVSVDATVTEGTGKEKVKASFRFVNTHFEAFDDETQRPSIRALQAQQLTTSGPAAAKKVILVGDLNSDVPGVKPGDEQAYQTMLDAGFTERSTDSPLSCCVSDLFSSPPSMFDHQVDHVMTNQSTKRVKLVKSIVVGTSAIGGIYPSDHAGIASRLLVR